MNSLRTAVLLAGLTGLFLAVGFMLGGEVGLVIAFALALAMNAFAYWNSDKLVLRMYGAREVGEGDAPALVRQVRQLAEQAELPMPKVYVIPNEGLNAFATGRNPSHAAVAVTEGLLRNLDREELQGVIGHELAHVANYDIRFSLLVGVLVGSIALLAGMMTRFWFFGGARRAGRSGGGGGGMLIFFLGLLVAILAPIFARLVQMSVNRQREFLADATSVELTRNPYGLERALAKLAADTEKLEVANEATQHLYVVNPVKKLEKSASGLFSTHPAIVDRINRLRRMTGQPELDDEGVRSLAGLP